MLRPYNEDPRAALRRGVVVQNLSRLHAPTFSANRRIHQQYRDRAPRGADTVVVRL
jgi:hypothetical protein